MPMNDPRPALAVELAARLAPAADALSESYRADYAEAGPLPEDDRERAAFHRAGRAMLAHLRQLLAVIDWSAVLLPPAPPRPLLTLGYRAKPDGP